MDIMECRCSQGMGSGVGRSRAKTHGRVIGNRAREEGRWQQGE